MGGVIKPLSHQSLSVPLLPVISRVSHQHWREKLPFNEQQTSFNPQLLPLITKACCYLIGIRHVSRFLIAERVVSWHIIKALIKWV